MVSARSSSPGCRVEREGLGAQQRADLAPFRDLSLRHLACLPVAGTCGMRPGILPIRPGGTGRSGVEHAHHVDLGDGGSLHHHRTWVTAPLLETAGAIQALGGSVAFGDAQLHLQHAGHRGRVLETAQHECSANASASRARRNSHAEQRCVVTLLGACRHGESDNPDQLACIVEGTKDRVVGTSWRNEALDRCRQRLC